jgi:hypothetical protein
MNNLEKDLIPYQEAFELKELGFDQPCLAYIYTGDTGNNVNVPCAVLPSKAENFNEDDLCVSTPTYSQAFRWFREKCGIGSWIHHYFDMDKGTFDYSYVLTLPHRGEEYVYDTHEEAEKKCLIKLIEIVKEKQK